MAELDYEQHSKGLEKFICELSIQLREVKKEGLEKTIQFMGDYVRLEIKHLDHHRHYNVALERTLRILETRVRQRPLQFQTSPLPFF